MLRGLGDFGRRLRQARLIRENSVEKDGEFAAADEGGGVLGYGDAPGDRGRRIQQRADGAEAAEDALGVGGAVEEEIGASDDLPHRLFDVGQLGMKASDGDGVVEEDGRQSDVRT